MASYEDQILEPDKYLASATRRLRLFPGTRYVERRIHALQQHYATHYRERGNSWTVIDDFDGNLRFRLDRSSYMGSYIYWQGYYSIDELHLLDRLLKKRMVFVDVGANQGEFTLFAAKRLHDGKVMAFEPVESNYQHLIENVRLNGFDNVVAHKCGLSDTPGNFDLYTDSSLTPDGLANEGLASMFRSGYRSSNIGAVQVDTFDRVFEESGLDRLDIIKIDVEGAELAVLRGARKSLARFRPTILMEINQEAMQAAGSTANEVFCFLDDLHYDVFLIGRHRYYNVVRFGIRGRFGKATRVEPDCRPYIGQHHFCDVLCIPKAITAD